MPKIRTHKASAKRFKVRSSGTIKRRNAQATHLLGKKSTKRKRAFRRNGLIASANSVSVKRALTLK